MYGCRMREKSRAFATLLKVTYSFSLLISSKGKIVQTFLFSAMWGNVMPFLKIILNYYMEYFFFTMKYMRIWKFCLLSKPKTAKYILARYVVC